MADFRDSLRNSSCELCPLNQSAMTVCLMGTGPARARIMIVGEAPGETEDEGGEPFIGVSGQFLNKLLTEVAGIRREDCYITNAVKCHPEGNATPSVRQIKTCADTYLREEIERVRPEWILTLGNSGLKGVVGKTGITKLHGTPIKYNDRCTVFPTFHPAAILRNPGLGDSFGMDLQRFGELTRGGSKGVDTKIHFIDTPKRYDILLRTLGRAREIAWDIETFTVKAQPPYRRTNFQEWHGDRISLIVTMAFSWREGVAAALPLHHVTRPWRRWPQVKPFSRLLEVMTRRDCRYIAHNGKFDARWMHAKGIPVRQDFDTMLAAHVIDENRPKSLKDLSQVLIGADGYGLGEELENAYYYDLEELLTYNGKDADYTLRLAHLFRPILKKDKAAAKIYTRLMMPASRALLRVEQRGVYMDPERWTERVEIAQDNVTKLDEYTQRKFVPKKMRPINLRSTDQLANLLFDHYELPVLLLTERGRRSTKDSVLKQLAVEHDVAKAIIKYRKWTKRLSTYFYPWWYQHRDRDGYLHGEYKPSGTVTGRLAGTGGIQQVPRDPWMRSLIGAPPGWVLLQADYSQIELRIAAMMANEDRMLRQYANREDLHMLRAIKMTGRLQEDITKEERSRAKPVSFGFIYGMGHYKFVKFAFDQYDIVYTEAEAKSVRDGFFEDYPRLVTWHRTMRAVARRYHQVRSPMGRVRHLPDMLSLDEMVRGDAERQAINSPVQTTASDIMLDSLIELDATLPEDEVRIVFSVHDAIGFYIREGKQEEWAPYIKETMEDMDRIHRRYGAEITVPIVVDLECGYHWSDDSTKIELKAAA